MALVLQDAGLSPAVARKIYSLLPSISSTRLVQLEKGSISDPLKASLIVVDIDSDSCPKYECISYTWGDDISPSVISIDGHDFPLRVNLDQALRRFRLTEDSRLLWVDAISIRQDDTDEKAQQVSMIGKIFQCASRVVAWLGEHSSSSKALFDTSEEVAGNLFNQDRDKFWKRYNDLGLFMDRRYWQRTWIVAEIICARELLICCGADSITWEHLLKYKFTDVMRFDQGWARKLTKLDDARNAHKFAQDPKNLTAVEWEGHNEVQRYLYATEGTDCFERRDKIFSLRAILHGTSMRNTVHVDYKRSIPALCADTLKAALVVYDHDQNNIADFLLLSYQLDKSLQMTRDERLQLIDILLDDQEDFDVPALDIVNDIFADNALDSFFQMDYEPYDPDWSWEQKREHVVSWRGKARQSGKWPKSL